MPIAITLVPLATMELLTVLVPISVFHVHQPALFARAVPLPAQNVIPVSFYIKMCVRRRVLQGISHIQVLMNVYCVIRSALDWPLICTSPVLQIVSFISIWNTHWIWTSIPLIGKLSRLSPLPTMISPTSTSHIPSQALIHIVSSLSPKDSSFSTTKLSLSPPNSLQVQSTLHFIFQFLSKHPIISKLQPQNGSYYNHPISVIYRIVLSKDLPVWMVYLPMLLPLPSSLKSKNLVCLPYCSQEHILPPVPYLWTVFLHKIYMKLLVSGDYLPSMMSQSGSKVVPTPTTYLALSYITWPTTNVGYSICKVYHGAINEQAWPVSSYMTYISLFCL